MKFFTGITLSALALIANSQEPVYLGNHALVIDRARLLPHTNQEPIFQNPPNTQKVTPPPKPRDYVRNLQFDGIQVRQIHAQPIALTRNLQDGVYPGNDQLINRRLQDGIYPGNDQLINRRLQNNYYNQKQDLKPLKEEIPIDKKINQPLIIIQPVQFNFEPTQFEIPQPQPFIDHDDFVPPITDPFIDRWDNHQRPYPPSGPNGQRNYPHKKQGNRRHGGKRHNDKMYVDEYNYPNGQEQINQQYSQYHREKQNKQGGKHKFKHAIFRGLMWVAGILLFLIVCLKCCCKKKCGRSKSCKRGINIDQEINFHQTEIRRLQDIKRASQNHNVRMVNPYNNFIHQNNPYQMPSQQFENERIAFGQRPSPVYSQQNRNIPMGRPLPENSFENSYPTL